MTEQGPNLCLFEDVYHSLLAREENFSFQPVLIGSLDMQVVADIAVAGQYIEPRRNMTELYHGVNRDYFADEAKKSAFIQLMKDILEYLSSSSTGQKNQKEEVDLTQKLNLLPWGIKLFLLKEEYLINMATQKNAR